MGRPKGSTNKIRSISLTATLTAEPSVSVPTPPVTTNSSAIHYDGIFAVRRHHTGPFAGLWELVKLDNELKRVKVITDANSKTSVMIMCGREIQRIFA